MMTGIDIIKPTVLSPAQAEKAGIHKSIIAGMVTKPSKGLAQEVVVVLLA